MTSVSLLLMGGWEAKREATEALKGGAQFQKSRELFREHVEFDLGLEKVALEREANTSHEQARQLQHRFGNTSGFVAYFCT